MRYDQRYTRTRDLITDAAVPRTSWGGILLCHLCQRRVYFAGGFLELLASQVKQIAQTGRVYKFGK